MIMKMNWNRLAVMAAVSFLAMYALMYAMVDTFSDVYPNLNQFYMAAMMTGVMMLIELGLMGSMYSTRVVRVVVVAGIVVSALSFFFIRNQTAVSDNDFLKSMISHHGAALLMCEKADLRDPEVKSLCGDIISSQQSQIDWMRLKLSSLKQGK